MGLMVCDIMVKPVTPEIFQRDSTPVEITILPGGDALNVAVNASALGMKTAVISAVGTDANGIFITNYLQECGIDISGIRKTSRYSTGCSIVLTKPDGERHFLSSTKIFEEVLPSQVTRELLEGASVLSLNGCYRLPRLDDGGVIPAFQLAHEMGVLTAMDTVWNRQGEWLPRISETLKHTDIFLPSYQEAVQITGETDVQQMRHRMESFGLKVFGVKMGDRGSYVTDFQDEYIVSPFRVSNVVNTVGAGDSFVAGFLTAQAKGFGLYDSAVFASAVAAHTVQTVGAVGGVPSMEEVLKFIHQNGKMLKTEA